MESARCNKIDGPIDPDAFEPAQMPVHLLMLQPASTMPASVYFAIGPISCRDHRSRLQQPITDPGNSAAIRLVISFTWTKT
jgi:hypothetical protein